MISELSLTLNESSDTDDGVVRLDQADMRLLGVQSGDIMALVGARTSYACALPAFMEDRNQRLVQVGPLLRRNIGTVPGQKVLVKTERSKPPLAEQVTLLVEDSIDYLHITARQRQLAAFWHERIVIAEDWLGMPTLDRHPLSAKVVATEPVGLVQIASGTNFSVTINRDDKALPGLGGMRDVYRTCYMLATARLRAGVATAARAVLLTGLPGCGKARLVLRLAKELDVPLVTLDAHQLLDQRLLRNADLEISLTALARRGPTIILLDHLEALTPQGNQSSALAVAGHAVLAQLYNVLDELPTQPNIMLFGTTSGELDQRFIDHRCFNLVLPVDAPNRLGRHEILLLATQNVPLADNVDLSRLAAMTSGTTARDLQQLVTTASLLAVEAKITENDFISALRHITPLPLSEVHCDIPNTSWEDVAGLDDVKQLMRDTLSWSLHHHEKFTASGVRPPRSILISGGQGTGKTSLVRALAGLIPMHFIEITCPLLASFDPAMAARFIHNAFALARRKTPCLVFLDNIDVLFEVGSGDEPLSHQLPIIAQLLVELDNLALIPGVVVIAATNRPDRLTTEILRPGRFDYAVTLPLPDAPARKRILQIHAHKLPLAADVDIDRLAGIMQGMSPAEIANVCNRVGLMALRQSLNSGDGGVIPPVVNAALFDQVLRGRKS